jgi:Winged helix DNA-binding domain
MVDSITRSQVLAFRVRRQQLDRDTGLPADTAVLDLGAQDTGPDGGRWALANRGVDVSQISDDELVLVWSIRGAPHFYQRSGLRSVAAAVEPFSDADAGKRIFDASRPLKAAGISNLDALDAVAAVMRSVVTRPMVKGEVSTRLTALMDPPYLRFCRPCNTIHLYEMPFRLAALRAGLELEAGTSPPVLRPAPGFTKAARTPQRYDVVRAYLRLLGPATPKQVAAYLDAPVRDVRAHWPDDAIPVTVYGEQRWILSADAESLADADSLANAGSLPNAGVPTSGVATGTRLLGPFDLFLQARDRQTLLADPARAKALWPVLGRPGAVLVNGEITGLWRPRRSGKHLRVQIELWARASAPLRRAITAQAERLAAHRGVPLSGVDLDG